MTTSSDAPAAGSLVFVKLGGSLITDKRRPESLRGRTLARLAEEIALAGASISGRLVLGHGSGSFGHSAAERAGFPGTGGSVDARAVAIVQDAAARLHRHVVEALLGAGAAPFSIVTGGAISVDSGEPESRASELPIRLIERGLLPVFYGDVVIGRDGTAVILSTETIFLTVVRALLDHGTPVDRVLWLGETDGVLDEEGARIPELAADDAFAMARLVGPAAGIDVTGGMGLRLETAAMLATAGVASWILDGRTPGVVGAALTGESHAGTHILVE